MFSNGTTYGSDGNVKEAAWGGGFLGDWIDSNYSRKATSSLQATGWFRDATTGLTTQWGIVKRSGDSTRVWFPTAFPNACVNVQLTLRNSNSGGNNSNVFANGEDGQDSIIYLTAMKFSHCGQQQDTDYE